MITVREPERQGRIEIDGETAESLPFKTVVAFLWQRRATYLTLFFGMSVVTIIGYGYFNWLPTMFVRTWGWTIPQIGFTYGMIMLICGPLGINVGGWLADRWYNQGKRAAHMHVTLIGAFLLVPFSVLVPLMPSAELAVVMLIPASIGGGVSTAIAGAALMMIVPNQMRAQTTALYYFIMNVLGLTLGPLCIALVTDYVFADELALRYSIALVSGVTGVIALALLMFNVRHYKRSVIEADAWSE